MATSSPVSYTHLDVYKRQLLVYRVYWLQQTAGEDLGTRATDNQFAVLTTNAPRGVIVDRNGFPLAINKPSFNVTITPAFLPTEEGEIEAVFSRLAELLSLIHI